MLRSGLLLSTEQLSVQSLTGRETQILLLARDGLTGREIATALHLASNTVAQHLVNVRRKLGVRTTAAAVAQATAHGLLQESD